MDKPIAVSEFLAGGADPSCGAVASFVGVVRDHDHGKPVKNLYYECYASMANKEIQKIIDEVESRWALMEIRVLHRTGWLEIGEAAVAVTVSAAHRDEAFSACRYVIDEIKKRAPIWKKQIFADGTSEWVLCGHAEVRENEGLNLSRR